jgi:hypothetical protein
MRHSIPAANSRRSYRFRGISFHITERDLPQAIREARRLHARLVDCQVAQALAHVRRLHPTTRKPRRAPVAPATHA